jgi:glycine cleavage system aminomethyltransferase T
VAALANFTACDVVAGGVPTTVSRVSYCGGLGYELHAPKENGGAASLYEQLRQSQAADVTEFGYTAMQVMRTEVARPCFTVEVPQGINYLDCVPKFLAKLKDHQADFCGRDAIKASAADKFLVHLQAEDPHFFMSCMNAKVPALGGPHRLLLDGEDVGYVTSGFYGFRAGRAVMFALADKRPDLGLTGKQALMHMARGRLAVSGADGALGSVVSVVSDAEGLVRA